MAAAGYTQQNGLGKGFTRQDVTHALRRSDNDPDSAYEYLCFDTASVDES